MQRVHWLVGGSCEGRRQTTNHVDLSAAPWTTSRGMWTERVGFPVSENEKGTEENKSTHV